MKPVIRFSFIAGKPLDGNQVYNPSGIPPPSRMPEWPIYTTIYLKQ
jgi:hypothetical protein